MDLLPAVEARNQQLLNLQVIIPRLYVDLQISYEAQKKELLDYKCKANYWETQFGRLKTREETLQLEVEELKAQLKKREQQLFGKSSEKQPQKAEQCAQASSAGNNNKKRGQQAGSAGHGRRDYSHLPVIDETVSLADASCPCCHLPYQELSGTEDSEVLEIIDVRAYRRAIHRKKYKRCCNCPQNLEPQIMSAPVTEKVIAKSKLGVSIWSRILLGKYEYQQPLNRLLEQLSCCGLALAAGTVTDGLQALLPLFIPVYDALVERSIEAAHWHADETGWKVFEEVEGKKNHRWYLWIFHNHETVIYKISPTRSSQVLTDYFGEDHQGGTLNVDRYCAYKAIAKSGLFILAFCWAHVRRDFLSYAKGYPQDEAWALSWVDKIAGLYYLNNQRIACREAPAALKQYQVQLKAAVEAMHLEARAQLDSKTGFGARTKVVKSLLKHWDGLTIFVDRIDIPMDNNLAERGLRSSVVGRKNYYGSGSIWAANLAAALFTIFKTLKLHDINPHTWLLAYLHECAMHGGAPPDTITHYLPWNMSTALKVRFAEPPKHDAEGAG